MYKPTIAVVTYNDFPYENGIHLIQGTHICVLARTFRKNSTAPDIPEKSPEYVTAADPNFQSLLSHTNSLRKIIVFVGKRTSGGIEIIDLFCKAFSTAVLLFVDCPHDSEEKIVRLKGHGISTRPTDGQYAYFEHEDPCDEAPMLEGLMRKYARIFRRENGKNA